MGEATNRNSARNIVAVLGDTPVVCRAIAHLVERGGYETRVVDTEQGETALMDIDVVLITAGGDSDRWGTTYWGHNVPVLRLVDTPEEKEAAEEKGILWPCTARKLHSALSRAAYERPL